MSGGHLLEVMYMPIQQSSTRSHGHRQETELPWQAGGKIEIWSPIEDRLEFTLP
jgi:hypothetical protein